MKNYDWQQPKPQNSRINPSPTLYQVPTNWDTDYSIFFFRFVEAEPQLDFGAYALALYAETNENCPFPAYHINT
jgi:hypothetical protein